MQLAGSSASRFRYILLAVFALAVLLLLFPALSSHSSMYLDKLDDIPDLKQTDSRFAFPQRGKDYCAPVVALDSFFWLYNKGGYKQIFGSKGEGAYKAGVKLAQFMKTNNLEGTTTENFLAGLKNYIQNATPYKISSLKYRGWNRHQAEFDDKNAIASLDWIKSGLSGNRSCWINIGWYEYDKGKNEYRRQAGHWVALAAWGLGLSGSAEPNTIIVRDPDPVLSNEARKIFISLKVLDSGKLSGPHQGLPRDARSYPIISSMGNGIDSSRGRIGIIDGAVILDLWPAFLSF